MEILIKYLKIMEIEQYCSFNLSLARGLDYYTGLIYETVLTWTDQVVPISGGGRFDDLLGMFSNKKIPTFGISIEIERIINILKEKAKNDSTLRAVSTDQMS